VQDLNVHLCGRIDGQIAEPEDFSEILTQAAHVLWL